MAITDGTLNLGKTLCIGVILVFAVSTSAALDVNDPMKPPEFALQKFRLAKLKNSNQLAKSKATTAKPTVKPLLLTSILIGQNRKVAIINDKMLVVGDRIGKAKLVKVTRDGVQLLKNGKRIELKLNNEITAIRKNADESKL